MADGIAAPATRRPDASHPGHAHQNRAGICRFGRNRGCQQSDRQGQQSRRRPFYEPLCHLLTGSKIQLRTYFHIPSICSQSLILCCDFLIHVKGQRFQTRARIILQVAAHALHPLADLTSERRCLSIQGTPETGEGHTRTTGKNNLIPSNMHHQLTVGISLAFPPGFFFCRQYSGASSPRNNATHESPVYLQW